MKIRLNKEMRNELIAYAETLVSFPEEEAKVEQAHAKAADALRAYLKSQVPLVDLAVLAKYDYARLRSSFDIVNEAGLGWKRFSFKQGEEVLFRNNSTIKADRATYLAVEDEEFQRQQLEKKRYALITDYTNLIKAARYFEELEDVWPEVTIMRDSIEARAGRNAISCLSAEALNRIKQDIAKRVAA